MEAESDQVVISRRSGNGDDPSDARRWIRAICPGSSGCLPSRELPYCTNAVPIQLNSKQLHTTILAYRGVGLDIDGKNGLLLNMKSQVQGLLIIPKSDRYLGSIAVVRPIQNRDGILGLLYQQTISLIDPHSPWRNAYNLQYILHHAPH